MSSEDGLPKSGEEIARSLVPGLLEPGKHPELQDSFLLWWKSLEPGSPQSTRSQRFDKAMVSFRAALKTVEAGGNKPKNYQIREALSEIMWKDLSSFANNREPGRTTSTLVWLFDILASWSKEPIEMDKVDEFFVKFYLDMTSMRHNTDLYLAVRERCTQSYIDALRAFKTERPAMLRLRRLLLVESYASLIQIASQRAIQCWNLKRSKDARQVLLTHQSAIDQAADLEREYEEAISGDSGRLAAKWMRTLNGLVHEADKDSGYEYIFGRIAEAAGDCLAYISKCEARSEINLGIKTYNEALLDDPAKIVEGVENAQTHFRNAAIAVAARDWELEGEALVRIAATRGTVFRQTKAANELYQRAMDLADRRNAKDTVTWYEEARRAIIGEERAETEANEERWARIRAAVEEKVSAQLKPIEEFKGDLKDFVEWIWKTYPPLSAGSSSLPEGLFTVEQGPAPPPIPGGLFTKATTPPLPPPVISLSTKAYNKLILRYHPDKGQGAYGEVWKQTAETIVKQLIDRRDKHNESKTKVED